MIESSKSGDPPIQHDRDRPLVDRHSRAGADIGAPVLFQKRSQFAIWASNSPEEAPRSATSCQIIPAAAAARLVSARAPRHNTCWSEQTRSRMLEQPVRHFVKRQPDILEAELLAAM